VKKKGGKMVFFQVSNAILRHPKLQPVKKVDKKEENK
jgi:hypothetical protein